MFTPYAVTDTDRFDEHRFPHIAGEVAGLQQSLREIESPQKAEVIISMLKDHSLKMEWLDGNRQLVKLLRSGSLGTFHMESLFNSSKHNAGFLSGLEAYISARLR